jgi:hypothetical protein
MMLLSYPQYVEKFADSNFARVFLVHYLQSGYQLETLHNPEDIKGLADLTVITLSLAVFPSFFLRESIAPNAWIH